MGGDVDIPGVGYGAPAGVDLPDLPFALGRAPFSALFPV